MSLQLLNNTDDSTKVGQEDSDPARNYAQSNNNEICNGRVYQSIIDCQLGRIFNLGSPLIGTDAANRAYVDSITSYRFVVNLSGTQSIELSPSPLFGAWTMQISSQNDGYPAGIFNCIKSSSSTSRTPDGKQEGYMDPNNQASSTFISVKWLAQQGISISKTNLPCDGLYNVSILR